MEDQEIYEIKTKVDVMEALLKQSNNILKAILGSIVTAAFAFSVFTYNYTVNNTAEHVDITKTITKHMVFTHNINENVIKPTEMLAKKNSIRLNHNDTVNSSQNNRIAKLEKINKI